MRNIVIRVGEGQSPSGKILDHYTHWFNINEYKNAIEDANDRNRNIYVSINNKKYEKVTPKQLIEFANKEL